MKINYGAIRHYGNFILFLGNVSLHLHNPSLSQINDNLGGADYQNAYSKGNFHPMRPYRGLPMAAGWAIVTLAAWAWFAYHDDT